MHVNPRGRSGSSWQRWADPALTVLAVELAVAIFVGAPLGLLAPGSGLVLPVLLIGLVITPVLYFSFTTLTTVGYGDVIPMHPLTRGLSNLEAVVGQLLPATLIARMVTLELAGRPPAAGAVRVPGFWDLQGDRMTAPRAGWVWVPGRWLTPPFRGAQWNPAHWGWADGWWSWIPGHWQKR
jgi:Ion channel